MSGFIVTIDTNCINVYGRAEGMAQLEDWERRRLIKIVSTPSLIRETHQNAKRLAKAMGYPNIGEPLFFDDGEGDEKASSVFVDDMDPCGAYFLDEEDISFEELKNICFPTTSSDQLTSGQINDISFLLAHKYGRADFFVTTDSHIIGDDKRGKLAGVGIKLFTPEGLAKHLIEKEGFKRTVFKPGR